MNKHKHGAWNELPEEELIRIRGEAQKFGIEDVNLVNAGGAGFVFSAEKEGRKVAIKLLKKPYDEQWLRRFRRESELLSKLNHDRLVQVFPPGLFDIASYHAFTMEYIHGASLKQWLADHGALKEKEALLMLKQVTDVLKYVHDKSVIHRDLHSGNILIAGEDLRNIKLADFGTARDYSLSDLSESVTYRTFSPIGSMSHCAPEKWINPHHVGPESDIFSLGVMMYYATTLKYPYWEDSYVKLYEKIVSGKHIPIHEIQPDISQEFSELIEQMINPSQVFRIACADDVLDECALFV